MEEVRAFVFIDIHLLDAAHCAVSVRLILPMNLVMANYFLSKYLCCR